MEMAISMKELSQVELENIYGGKDITLGTVAKKGVQFGFIGKNLGEGAVRIAEGILTHNYIQIFRGCVKAGIGIGSLILDWYRYK